MGIMGSQSELKKQSLPKAVTEEGSTLNEMVGCHKFNCWERE